MSTSFVNASLRNPQTATKRKKKSLNDVLLPEKRLNLTACAVETVQDFLMKLEIKPLSYLLEISIFFLNNDLVRLAKIMNNLAKDLKIRSFKDIFQYLKLVESFQKRNSVNNI